jgi:hypothetical protein
MLGALIAVSTLIAVITSTNTAQLLAPSWLSALGKVIRRLRD